MDIKSKVLKYARTTITNDNGTITTARVTLSTGEVKPYKYNRYDGYAYIKRELVPDYIDYGAEGDLLGYVPYWVNIPPPDYKAAIKEGFKPRVSKDNPNNIYLTDYNTFDDALYDMQVLDNMFEGVSLLNDGKSRPMNKGLMFNMLRDLEVINSETIQGYTGHCERHCQKLALYLRVLSNAFDREVDRA